MGPLGFLKGVAGNIVKRKIEKKLEPWTDIRDAWKNRNAENPTPAMREANRAAVNEKKGLNRNYPGKGKH